MDKGAVERIHQADNAVIDRAVEQRRKLNHSIGRGRQGKRRDVGNRLMRLQRVWNEHPHITISLMTRIRGHADLVGLDGRPLDERRNVLAPAFVIESPTVITTLHAIAAEPPEGERHSTVRADIPEGCDISRGVFPHQNRKPEEHHAFHAPGAEIATRACRVPKPEQRRTLGGVNFCDLIQGLCSRDRLDYICRRKLGQGRCVDRKNMRRL